MNDDENWAVTAIDKNLFGKFGIVEKRGKLITSFAYDEYRGLFFGSLLVVKCNGKWGFIDCYSGDEESQFVFEDIKDIGLHEQVAIQIDGKWGKMTKPTNLFIPYKNYLVLEPKYDNISVIAANENSRRTFSGLVYAQLNECRK